MKNQIENLWDAKQSFCKANRIKLTQCFSSDVSSLTEYSKYIGRNYLTIKFRDYDDSIYAQNHMNTIEFKWGDYKKTYNIMPGTWNEHVTLATTVTYLQDALDWYAEIKQGIQIPIIETYL